MAHPDGEAVDAPSFDTDDDAIAALENHLADEGDEPEEDEEDSEPETDDEGDEPESDEDDDETEDDEDDEPETAIEPPVSLNAEEKAKFAQLPQEAQRLMLEVESRRNTQVQEATTKAAQAQRLADEKAATAEAEAKAVFAQQLKAFSDALAPQKPDVRLASHDPAAYLAQQAEYEAAIAQHRELVQHVESLAGEADQTFTMQQQQWQAEQVRELMQVPEFADEAKRPEFLKGITEAGRELGYSDEDLGNVGAKDVLALKRYADMKSKAEKYDALQARKMQRVRDAKTAKPNAAQPRGSGKTRALQKSTERLRQTGDISDAAAAISQFL